MITIIAHCQSSTSVSPKPGITVEATKLVAAPAEPGKTSPNAGVFEEGGISSIDLQKILPAVRGKFVPGKLYKVTFEEYTPKA